MATDHAPIDSASDRDQGIKDVSLGVEQNVTSEEHAKPLSRFTRWYRSPLFNVIIVGLISFTQPGIWNALNSQSLPIIRHQILTRLRHWRWWSTRAVPRQWSQLSHIWYHGLWLLPVWNSCQQNRPQDCSHSRHPGLRSLLGGSLHQQPLWGRMVRSFWGCHLWNCGVRIMGV